MWPSERIEIPFSHGSGSHCAWPMNASRGEMKKKPARVALAVGVEEAVLEVAAEPQVVAAHRHRDELGVLQRPVVGPREALRPVLRARRDPGGRRAAARVVVKPPQGELLVDEERIGTQRPMALVSARVASAGKGRQPLAGGIRVPFLPPTGACSPGSPFTTGVFTRSCGRRPVPVGAGSPINGPLPPPLRRGSWPPPLAAKTFPRALDSSPDLQLSLRAPARCER